MPRKTTASVSTAQLDVIRRISSETRYPYGVIIQAAGELLEGLDPAHRDARLKAAASTPSAGDTAQHGETPGRKQPPTRKTNTHRTAPPSAQRRRGAA